MSRPTRNRAYGQNLPLIDVFPFPFMKDRAPVSTDKEFEIGQIWVYKVSPTTRSSYTFGGLNPSGDAIWINNNGGGGSGLSEVTVSAGDSPVTPDGDNSIAFLGTANQIVSTGNETDHEVIFSLADEVEIVTSIETPLIIGGDTGSLNIELGDASGATFLNVKDSGNATVASIDSDGNLICVNIASSGVTQNIGTSNSATTVNMAGGTGANTVNVLNGAATGFAIYNLLGGLSATGIGTVNILNGTTGSSQGAFNLMTQNTTGQIKIGTAAAAEIELGSVSSNSVKIGAVSMELAGSNCTATFDTALTLGAGLCTLTMGGGSALVAIDCNADSNTISFGVGGDPLADFSGNVAISGSAKQLQVKGGAVTDFIGTAVLSGGTVVVANTNISADDRIFLSRSTTGGTEGTLSYTISAGASFTITSSSGTDTSTIAYLIVRQL
jgi:hypothetical protein